MKCPCCSQEMKYNEWEKIHVCRCQGVLLEYLDLKKKADASLKPNFIENKELKKEFEQASAELPDTQFYTIMIKPDSVPVLFSKFLNDKNYYFDFKNKVWFKKVRWSEYPSEKQALDKVGLSHQVLAA